MPIIEGTTGVKVYVGDYSFAVDGGAEGAITLRSNTGPIPSGSLIMSGVWRVTTAFTTSAAGEAAVAVEGAGDLITAAVVSGAPYSTTGVKDTALDGSGSTMIVTTAARSPTITITVGAITAGVGRLTLTYV